MNRVLMCFWLAVLLASCTKPMPDPNVEQAVEKALPETSGITQTFSAPPGWSDVIVEGAAGVGWLKTFGVAELERIAEEALQNNRELAVAGVNLNAAAALATEAGAYLVAAVDVSGGSQSTDNDDTAITTAGAALNTQWELDIWGKLAAAEAGYRATEADLEAARQSLVAQIAKAWFLATEANLQLALTQEALEIYQQRFEIAETRVDVGAGSPQDAILARADLNAARERQHQAVWALTQAMRSMKLILGRYPSAELEVVRKFVPTPPGIPLGIPAELLGRRQDLIAAERRVAAAFPQVDSARAAKLPDLSLTAAGGAASNELLELVGAGSDFFSLGSNFIAPPGLGDSQEARVQIETAQQEAALANYGNIALRALSEVESSLTNESLLRDRESLLSTSVDDDNEALTAVSSQHDNGQVDLLTVLQMQARALNSRISLIRIRNARLVQRVDLHLALGGGFSD